MSTYFKIEVPETIPVEEMPDFLTQVLSDHYETFFDYEWDYLKHKWNVYLGLRRKDQKFAPLVYKS